MNNLEELTKLRDSAKDKAFQEKWRAVKRQKKVQLAAVIKQVREACRIGSGTMWYHVVPCLLNRLLWGGV